MKKTQGLTETGTESVLNKEIDVLQRLNNRSRDILCYGSKARLERMELKAWIGRNNARIKALEQQRDAALPDAAQTGATG